MKGHTQNFRIFRRGIEVIQMHRQQFGRQILIRLGRTQSTCICRFISRRRRWNRFGLFPTPQTTKLRIKRHHVGQRRGSRTRKTDDVNGTKHRSIECLRMLRQPGFKMQPVLEAPAKRRHHRFINRRIKRSVTGNAFQKSIKPLTKVTWSEIGEPRVSYCLRQKIIDARVSTVTCIEF